MKEELLRIESWAVGAIAVFSGLFLLQTYEYGRRAALFPRLISAATLFLTVFLMASRIRRALQKRRSAAKEASVRSEAGSANDAGGGVNWLVTLSAVIGYCALIYLAGFGAATFFYVAAHLYLAGYRRPVVLFSFALAMAIVMIAIATLFAIPLPQGALEKMVEAGR